MNEAGPPVDLASEPQTPDAPAQPVAATAPGPVRGTSIAWIGLLGVALLIGGGRDLFIYATVAVAISIWLRLVAGRRYPDLLTAFQLGFVVIVSVEGILRADDLIDTMGPERFDLVSRYLTAGLAIVSLGHLVANRPTERSDLASARGPEHLGIDRSRSLAMIAIGTLAYFGGIWPRLITRVTSGRVATVEPWLAGTALEPLITHAVDALGMLLPAAITFHLVRNNGARARVALTVCSPILVVQFAIGTRYPLLFAVAGMVITLTASSALRPGVLVRALVIGAAVFIASSAMTQFRSAGLGNAEALTVSTDRIAEGERTIENLGEISAWFDHEGYRSGLSSLTVTFFFVPRTMWPDKPEALGYWFPRRYGTTGFSEGHSIAYSFAGDPYADFGYGGGLVALVPVGVGLGLIDRWCRARLAHPSDARLVVAAPLFGAAFLAARSLDTAIIAGCFIVGIGAVYVRLARPKGEPAPVVP